MKTPDEIKRGLAACAEDDCRDCAYYKGKATCLQGMIADALAYIKRLEAELLATRTQLSKDGDLCRICRAQHAEDCIGDCLECTNKNCLCNKCIDTDGKEGFAWDGGADHA